MRTNLTDDHKIITLWPAESISRGDRSRLPFRRIWQSTRPNFSPLLSTPAFPDTSENIFEGAPALQGGLYKSRRHGSWYYRIRVTFYALYGHTRAGARRRIRRHCAGAPRLRLPRPHSR